MSNYHKAFASFLARIKNALNIFKKYNVEFIDQKLINKNIIFDSDKFNNDYKLGITYFGDNYYVLSKPYSNCGTINGIRINEDGIK